jgi:molecular chaperone Hsp33
MLQLIGEDEVDAVLAEQGSVDVNCEFCNQRYVFEADDVAEVFAEPVETATRH